MINLVSKALLPSLWVSQGEGKSALGTRLVCDVIHDVTECTTYILEPFLEGLKLIPDPESRGFYK